MQTKLTLRRILALAAALQLGTQALMASSFWSAGDITGGGILGYGCQGVARGVRAARLDGAQDGRDLVYRIRPWFNSTDFCRKKRF